MPVNNYSVARDLTFSVVTPSGTLALAGKTDYSIKPMTTDLKHKGMDGIVEHGVIPDGWQVTIKLDRRSPELDAYFAAREADYFAGVNQQAGTILESITEADGSISQYRYTGVILKYDDAGDWKGDSNVSVSLTGMASRRIKVQ